LTSSAQSPSERSLSGSSPTFVFIDFMASRFSRRAARADLGAAAAAFSLASRTAASVAEGSLERDWERVSILITSE